MKKSIILSLFFLVGLALNVAAHSVTVDGDPVAFIVKKEVSVTKVEKACDYAITMPAVADYKSEDVQFSRTYSVIRFNTLKGQKLSKIYLRNCSIRQPIGRSLNRSVCTV